jgi:alkylhydroperoxidase family enzyme
MPWIQITRPGEATGRLKRLYDEAVRRAGRVWGILSVMSPNPPVLDKAVEHYKAVMYGRSPLSRGQREMLATVVSAVNHCVY